ncbi:MAG: hypothetical protein J0J00_12290, partial [Microbacterium sp.]|nr:hypothetical protein [Microbacterium sp.]
MLLERDLIQSVGFRNVREGGEITGFQVRVRIPNYRGLAAPLIDGISVHVDDVVDVGPEVPLWTLQGGTYTLAQLWDSDGVRWPLEEAAIVTVPHPGGLSDGVHEVSVEILLRASYIPIEHQPSRTRAARHVTRSPEADGAPFRYGVSLYSYTDDFNTVLGHMLGSRCFDSHWHNFYPDWCWRIWDLMEAGDFGTAQREFDA